MATFQTIEEEKKYYETIASEIEFLSWYKEQDLPKHDTPSVTIDNVILCYDKINDQLKMLLIQRKSHPFQWSWALPGGFVERNESTEETCLRETKEETGITITPDNIEQLHTFSNPGRDPRGWVITVSYLAYIGEEPITFGDDAINALWFNLDRCENYLYLENNLGYKITLDLEREKSIGKDSLAFDHDKIIVTAFKHILEERSYNPKVLRVLGDTFTISEARKVMAKVLGVDYKTIDHSNYKRIMLHLFAEVGERPTGKGRPSKLYRLKETLNYGI